MKGRKSGNKEDGRIVERKGMGRMEGIGMMNERKWNGVEGMEIRNEGMRIRNERNGRNGRGEEKMKGMENGRNGKMMMEWKDRIINGEG
ncbi:unnamed protein product [Chrysodeixis includens]|uniref:Uncharacterized protein n=1 Tax=Chrysodeixis includens TaxID=689277 RepID=A0A9N8PZB7_CHRIL|nr:unnamed protein product [Chrysodeixis includens]